MGREAMRGLDPVAYVRFASVYRDFREASDFAEVLGEIAREPARARPAGAGEEAAWPEIQRPGDVRKT